jgi:hypothetical protein
MYSAYAPRRLATRASLLFGLFVTAALCSASMAATITVNSLADDVFSDSAGVWAATATKCTLRMAIAASNEDQNIGGPGGCVASSVYTVGGRDTIRFTGLTGTITLANQPMFTPDFDNIGSPQHILVVRQPTIFIGPGAAVLTIDGGHTAGAPRTAGIMNINSVSNTTSIDGLKFANARAFGVYGGCIQASASLFLSNVVFDGCISEGNAVNGVVGWGGALNVFGNSTRSRSVSMTDVTFSNNKALLGTVTTDTSAAGAFTLGSNGTATLSAVLLRNVVVTNNEAQNAGGARISGARSVAIVNSSFTTNQATTGVTGGLDIRNIDGPITLRDVTITGNSAGTDRGGLSINNGSVKAQSSVVATGLKVNNNTATRYIAGASFTQIDNVVIENSEFNGNTGNNNTGGLSIDNNNVVVMRDSAVSNNIVNNGKQAGMGVASNGSVLMERVKIQGNRTTKSGSAFSGHVAIEAERNGAFALVSSEISGNTSADSGVVTISASYGDRDSAGNAASPLPPLTNTVSIENVAIGNNTSPGNILNLNTPGIYTVSNTTIANNAVTAGCFGGISGGAYNPFSAANAFQVRIRSSTFARNSANCGTALGFGSYTGTAEGPFNGSVTVESSILGLDVATGSTTSVMYMSDPSKLTLTNGIVEDSGSPVSAQCTINGNRCNIDTKLDTLANNGGPTQTMRLLPGSPAIDTGSNSAALATDQRGAARTQGTATDIGAYETPAGSSAQCKLDMDGDNAVLATKEGLVLLRSMLGFSSAAATANTGITQAQWDATRANLNANCGTSLP